MPFRTVSEQRAAIDEVTSHLQRGGLIACPTETVYGFGSLLLDSALDALARLKRRNLDKAFLVLVLDASMAPGVLWTDEAARLAGAFWPGPLTIALRAEPGTWSDRVVGRSGAIALRATSHEGVRMLLASLGEPISSTSANAPGGEPARSATDVDAALSILGEEANVIILDGGLLPASPPSTIVDCSVSPPRVVRIGAIGTAELTEIVHGLQLPAT